MTQHSKAAPQRKAILAIGITLVVVALLVLVGSGVWLANKGKVFDLGVAADAILFIDVPGRIAIDGTLQIDGPAPVAVSVGKHTLTFFDIASKTPLEIVIAQDEFRYIPNPAASRSYYASKSKGVIYVSAFPPNTTIEIPDCTPLDTKYPVTCKSSHTLSAELSPGSYTIKYSNPHLGDHQESFTSGADSVARREHSFIATVEEWDTWRQQHGDIIEQSYSRSYRRYGGGSALLLPLEATGELLGELFD